MVQRLLYIFSSKVSHAPNDIDPVISGLDPVVDRNHIFIWDNSKFIFQICAFDFQTMIFWKQTFKAYEFLRQEKLSEKCKSGSKIIIWWIDKSYKTFFCYIVSDDPNISVYHFYIVFFSNHVLWYYDLSCKVLVYVFSYKCQCIVYFILYNSIIARIPVFFFVEIWNLS